MDKIKPDESIIREGLRIERFGRNILIDVKPTKTQTRKIKKIIPKLKKTLPQNIEIKAKEIKCKVKEFDTFDILSLISYRNLFVDPETVKEYSHKGNPFCIEYLALLCLKSSYNKGTEYFPDFGKATEIQEKLEEIFNDLIFFYIIEDIDPNILDNEHILSKLRLRTKTHEQFVRNPAYPHHFAKVLTDLFSHPTLEAWMNSNINIKINDAIELCTEITKYMEDKIYDKQKESFKQQRKIMKEIDQFRKGKWQGGKCDIKFLSETVKLSKKEAAQRIKSLGTLWIYFALGNTFSFSPKELSDYSNKSVEIVESFLKTFSVDFNSVSTDLYIPDPTHILKLKPIIHHNGRYLCPVPYLLIWSIKPLFEAFLKPNSNLSMNKDNKLWQKYQKIRSEYLESESLNLFKVMLKDAEIHKGLEYIIKEGGKEKRRELDGLIVFDSALLLIECKAGTMTPPALRGAPKRMESDLKKLLVDAHSQALQAKKYINQEKKPIFYDSKGNKIFIDKVKIEKVFLITISLDSLTIYTTNLQEISKLNMFDKGDLPWAVSLLDLIVLAELIEFSSQLIHYLLRRLGIYDIEIVETYDEIDWFGHYLKEGLYFENYKKSGLDSVTISTYTTEIDDYYFYVTGKRKTPAPKPSQNMPSKFKRIIKEVEDSKPKDYLNIALTLLDLDGISRKEFCRDIQDTIKRAQHDRKIHHCTGHINNKKGITFMCAKKLNIDVLSKNLFSYCALKKKQKKFDVWIGLGSTLNKQKLVEIVYFFN